MQSARPFLIMVLMNICLFTEEEISGPLSLQDERARHIIKILHKAKGENFAAGIIGGPSGTAVITDISDALYFSFTPTGDGKPLFPLKMIVGFPRPIQLKRLLRDMAALGVSEIHLTGTELGEKSYMQSDMATTDAGYKMLLDGTVQAAGTHVPLLMRHHNLKDCLSYVTERGGAGAGFFALDNALPEKSLGRCLKDCESPLKEAVAAIGSERGWTNRERAMLREAGVTLTGMGSRVMRTETAATVSAGIILSAMGFLE